MQKKLDDALQKLELNRSRLQLDEARIPTKYTGPISAYPLMNTKGDPDTMENRLSAIALSAAAQHLTKTVPDSEAIVQRMQDENFEGYFQNFTDVLDRSAMGRIGDPDLDRATLALLLAGRAQGQSICLCVARGSERIYVYPRPSKKAGRLEDVDVLISLEPTARQVWYLGLQEVKDGYDQTALQQGDGGLSPRAYEDVAIGMDPNPFRHPGAGVIADPQGLRRRIVQREKHTEHAVTPRLKVAPPVVPYRGPSAGCRQLTWLS